MLWWHAPNIMSLFFSFRCCQPSIHSFFVTSSSFFGGERKHSHFPKLKSEKVKILTSPSIFADIGTKITVMENILHAFSSIRPSLSARDIWAHIGSSSIYRGELSFLSLVQFCICSRNSAIFTGYVFRQEPVCVRVPNWKNVL